VRIENRGSERERERERERKWNEFYITEKRAISVNIVTIKKTILIEKL